MTGTGSRNNPFDLATALLGSYRAEDTLILLTGDYVGDFNINTSYPLIITKEGEVLIDGELLVTPVDITIKDLHIKDSDFTTRWTDTEGSSVPSGVSDGIRTIGDRVILQDCIVENCAGGATQQDARYDMVYDGCIIYYNGWNAPDRQHGHGIYAGKRITIKNCIVFSNSALGIKIYAGNCSDSIVEDNICFNNSVIFGQPDGTAANIFYGSDGARETIENPIVRRNCTYQLPAYLPHNINEFGYAKTFLNGILEDNYMPDGCDILSVEDGYTDITWADGQPSGNVFAPEETNHIKVYDVRGRAHVAVYNWELLEAVTIDLSTVSGMNIGDSVTVTNVEDYFVDVVTKTLDANKCISVSMKASDHTVQAGQGFDTPATCFPEFGCFVIRKT